MEESRSGFNFNPDCLGPKSVTTGYSDSNVSNSGRILLLIIAALESMLNRTSSPELHDLWVRVRFRSLVLRRRW